MDLTPPQPSAENLPDPQSPAAPTIPPPPSAQDPSAQNSTQDPAAHDPAHDIFYGVFGLRAIWSLLIYFAILGAIVGSFYFVRHQVHEQSEHVAAITAAKTGKPAPPLTPIVPQPDAHAPELMTPMIIGEIVLFAGFFFLSWLMAIIERRKLSAFGLGGAHPIRRCLIGALWGILAISLLILTLRGFHLLAFDTRLDHGRSIFYWGFLQLFAFLLVGFCEEYTFRGYIQFTLTRGLVSIGNLISPRHARAIGFWIAAVLTSAIFLYAHTRNSGENWLGLFQVFLVGLVFVVALWRTGSLWWGIGFHMAWDWGQSFLYGVPDSGGLMQGRLFATHALGKPLYSGGTVGPEGSVLCIPIMILVIAVLLYTHPSPQPPLEAEASY